MMRTDVIRKLVLPFLFATASRGDARDIYDYINRRLPTPVEFREVMENHPRERQRWAMALCEKITENDYGLSPQKTHPEYKFPRGPNVAAYWKKWDPTWSYNRRGRIETSMNMAFPYIAAVNYHEQFLSDEECRVFRTNMIHRAKVSWDYVHAHPWRRKLSPDPFAETPEDAEARRKTELDRFRY